MSVTRTRVRVEGVVQGVGFRPFVRLLATSLSLVGYVRNDSAGVLIEVEGAPVAVREFLATLEREPPPLAAIERVTSGPVPTAGGVGFDIVASEAGAARSTLVAADTATCADCLRELWDPADRRFRYPFVNCTHCGPRFTIVRDVPYDRPMTTMAGFALCADCEGEYHDPGDRRFHAQPVCCPACGPALRLTDPAGGLLAGEPVAAAAELLRQGAVLAVKGLGGFHLAVDAGSEDAAAALRARKHREDKPFAVMVADVDAARALCVVDDVEERLLAGTGRPIVLLRRHPHAPVAPSVAPGNPFLGVLLPYTPLHHLLLAEVGRPLVMTSGNVSDEPIVYRDEAAYARLGPLVEAFLTHDRPIHVRADDSVARVSAGRELLIRRSRGYAPRPVTVPWEFRRPVLACGAELKSTFCLGRGRHAFVSGHLGDLENYETLRSFTEGVSHHRRLFDVRPEVVAHDLHPEYLSTKYALDLGGVDLVGVQHHHAHIASCLADNGEAGPVIGVAFDGLGYGTDGTLWGGEFLVADLAGYRRAGHLEQVPMPGGAAAVREPWRMAAAWLDRAFEGDVPEGLGVARRHGDRWADVVRLGRAGLSAPVTSSAGRLFDAVAALVGVRDTVSYEGQAAIELERLADAGRDGSYEVLLGGGDPFVVSGAAIVRGVTADVLAGTAGAVVAGRFHRTMARVVLAGAVRLRTREGLSVVALSGGVFQNVVLLGEAVALLTDAGFRVLTHSRVPPNDGGISLGQAVVAGARDRA
ncbi:carbamoyltransferase [Longispora fulva]|uniref:Carbamoyltransferase n=1 Tax=Longispora fulva TaxID=619741 RepID=A0A8J7GFA3_9ACTN|nr:carbamoyltransferase HypF [Longispora fulva]MBG6135472.1 hydrogenase maturation protein HypF [Longispora fulva]GIG56286.1 carbamoyltransferase [Longispora fulva]